MNQYWRCNVTVSADPIAWKAAAWIVARPGGYDGSCGTWTA